MYSLLEFGVDYIDSTVVNIGRVISLYNLLLVCWV